MADENSQKSEMTELAVPTIAPTPRTALGGGGAVTDTLCWPPDETPQPLTDQLDYALRIVARLIALGTGLFVLAGGFIMLFFGEGEVRHRVSHAAHALGENWKAVPVVLIPIFYLPLRRLIYRARAFGAGHPVSDSPLVVPNPKDNAGTRAQSGGAM